MFKIDQLPELVKDYLGNECEFLDYITKSLTAPGENYGSLILSCDMKVKNKENNLEKIVKLVAKTPPPSEFAQKIFNPKVTFKNEIQFYRHIWPTMQELQKQHNLKPADYIAGFAGARYNLNKSQEIDENAVLLLENLVVNGFELLNRTIGFDLECSKLILRDLANFHATGITYKLQRPEDFKINVIPYLDGMKEGEDEFQQNYIQQSIEVLEKDVETKSLAPKARALLANKITRTKTSPFTTMIHNDLWTNNILIKLEKKSTAIANKIVDFQTGRYLSPADDLLFFLLSSVQNEVALNNFEDLIHYYYKQLVLTLENLKNDTTIFSYENFEKELKEAKIDQLIHTIWMLFPIFLDKSNALDVKDLDSLEDNAQTFEINDAQKEKLKVVVKCYEKMGWLN